MANFLQDYGIQPKMTSDMSDKKKVNLFDFTNVKKPSELMAQQTKPTQSGFSNVSKSQENLFDTYMNDNNISKQGKYKMLSDVQSGKITETEANEIIQQIYGTQEQPKPESKIGTLQKVLFPAQAIIGKGLETDFGRGAIDKTKESFVGGLERIKEAGVGQAEGKYNFMEGAVRGGAGALQTAFSPLSGIVGETIESGVEKIPEDIRTKIKQEAEPTIEGLKEWYNNQPADQQRRLQNIGVTLELLANFIGVKGIQKATPTIKQGIETTSQVLKQGGDKLVDTGKVIGTKLGNVGDSIGSPITRKIPEAVVKRDLGFTPTERAKIEGIVGKTESQYILDKGLAGKGKEELAEIFAKQANDMYNGIGTELKKVKGVTIKSKEATEALEDMLDQLTSKDKFKRAYAEDIAGIEKMLTKGEYTLDELNNIRRAYDKVNTGMYTAKGEIRGGLDNEIDVKIRAGINKALQTEAKKYGIDVKAMNTELRAGIEMKDALLRRLSQEERNNFLGLQDIGVSAILSGGNPIGAVALIGAKKYGESIAPRLAQKVYNLNKSKNVTPRMSRGNPITSTNKSTKLGLADSTRSNMVESSIKPTILKESKSLPQTLAPKKLPSIETKLKNLTTENIDDVARSFTNDAQKLAKIKVVIREHLKKYGNEFKNYMAELVDKIADTLGTRMKFMGEQGIGRDKTALLKGSDDLVSESRKYKSADEFVKDLINNKAVLYHGGKSKTLADVRTDFADTLSKTNQVERGKLFAEGPGIYFTSSIKEAKGYGSDLITTKPSKAINLITEKSKKLSKVEIKKIINDLPQDRINIAKEDWGGLDELINAIYDNNNTINQIQSIWSDALFNQNNKDFINALAKNGIDGIVKKKGDNIHTIIYNKNALK